MRVPRRRTLLAVTFAITVLLGALACWWRRDTLDEHSHVGRPAHIKPDRKAESLAARFRSDTARPGRLADARPSVRNVAGSAAPAGCGHRKRSVSWSFRWPRIMAGGWVAFSAS